MSITSSTTDISAVHSDIIQTHIFTRLDGPTIASISCVSSELHMLSTQEKLWKDISTATWPSIKHPLVQEVISTFPSGHRSFFSDAFPLLSQQCHGPNRQQNPHSPSSASHIISAIDIYYDNETIFSKVHDTGLVTGWLECTPFRDSLLDLKESVPTSILHEDATIKSHLEENLTLSWILIDPTQKRAANLSSLRPVSVQWHWLTGDIQVRYATILTADDGKDSSELFKCGIMVTFGGKEGEEMHVREVIMQVEDIDGRILNGEESLLILQGALKSGRRKEENKGEEKKKYEKYLEMKRERREKEQGREWNFDLVSICLGLTILVSTVCGIVFLIL